MTITFEKKHVLSLCIYDKEYDEIRDATVEDLKLAGWVPTQTDITSNECFIAQNQLNDAREEIKLLINKIEIQNNELKQLRQQPLRDYSNTPNLPNAVWINGYNNGSAMVHETQKDALAAVTKVNEKYCVYKAVRYVHESYIMNERYRCATIANNYPWEKHYDDVKDIAPSIGKKIMDQ